MTNALRPAPPRVTGGVWCGVIAHAAHCRPKILGAVAWSIRFIQGTTAQRYFRGGGDGCCRPSFLV